ncbi:MAG TPA: nuclear transport factor 2 family protein [Bryobacteraceae bacterium]|nr:nuclear transport factor 2 family protein [Bryobacteraceae bacterium]
MSSSTISPRKASRRAAWSAPRAGNNWLPLREAGRWAAKNVGWKDWSHLMVNHVITPTPQGASGRVYLVAIGEKGPRDVTRYGGYEDQYVKTSAGWRIRKRTHVRNKAWSNPLLQSADLN